MNSVKRTADKMHLCVETVRQRLSSGLQPQFIIKKNELSKMIVFLPMVSYRLHTLYNFCIKKKKNSKKQKQKMKNQHCGVFSARVSKDNKAYLCRLKGPQSLLNQERLTMTV